ncbi:MAG: AtpZ/AtpI family protein [Desulfosalsimonas sp.]|uniref:AtpZ/AtpI family protein n=1 Tax=Desulfosalsimonas sp. TaxID=3073848 RepID=UPI00397054B1
MAPKKIFNFKDNRPWAQNLQIVVQVGLTMAGCIVFCLFVGRFLDGWLGTKGIFTILFILFGIVGGAVVVYRQIMEVTEPDTEQKKNKHRDGRG